MSGVPPVQAFQIGQRVRRDEATQDDHRKSFIIRAIYLSSPGLVLYSSEDGYPASTADELSLAPDRPPYVPSERRIVYRNSKNMRSAAALHDLYRCETDAEMAERHADERAKYDAQGEGE